MYKEKFGDVVIYIICYKKEEMELVEGYYDEILNEYCLYFNGYLAYVNWLNNFSNYKKLKDKVKILLTYIAFKYILYQINNNDFKSNYDYLKLKYELNIIEPNIKEILLGSKYIKNVYSYNVNGSC